MRLVFIFNRSRRTHRGEGRGACRPRLETLEDRTMPNATPIMDPIYHRSPPTPAPATHFEVITPENALAGVPASIKVVALDASNQPVRNFTGTVHFTSSDASAVLPANYTFTGADHGAHTFQVTLETTGDDTVTATDAVTKTTTITGSGASKVVQPPPATHFEVVAPAKTSVGQQETIQVVALDASNHVVPNYTGTVSFTSSDAGATLPANFTFTAADHGRHSFTVTFATTGSQTVTATDAKNSLKGDAAETVKPAVAPTRFIVVSTPVMGAGDSFSVFVAAVDASGRLAPDYTGTVHFTSSDGGATLPADYTFTAADQGVHVFTVTLTGQGRQTLTVADKSNTSLTGKEKVFVSASLGDGMHPLGASSILAAL